MNINFKTQANPTLVGMLSDGSLNSVEDVLGAAIFAASAYKSSRREFREH